MQFHVWRLAVWVCLKRLNGVNFEAVSCQRRFTRRACPTGINTDKDYQRLKCFHSYIRISNPDLWLGVNRGGIKSKTGKHWKCVKPYSKRRPTIKPNLGSAEPKNKIAVWRPKKEIWQRRLAPSMRNFPVQTRVKGGETCALRAQVARVVRQT